MHEPARHGLMRWLRVFVPVALVACVLAASAASPARADSIPTVTVESSRAAKQLRHDVDVFVSSAITKSWDESLMRWNQPICPLVAGFNRPMAEFLLLRISNLARSVHAPLDGEKCRPNLFVLVAQNPTVFLKLLWRHNPRMFDTRNGIEAAKRFIETPRPIRAWYNANEMTADNTSASAFTSILAQSAGTADVDYPVFVQPSSIGSRLTHGVVRNLSNVIVVIDPAQINKLNVGQLADYVGLISLAQIDLDKNLGEAQAPSILKVFNPDETTAPLEMTEWDRALLSALYATSQKSRLQLSEMEDAVFKEISAQSAQSSQSAQ